MEQQALPDEEGQRRLSIPLRLYLYALLSFWIAIIGGHYYRGTLIAFRGIETEARLETPQMEACFGFRCSRTVVFSGRIDDPRLPQFAAANCHKISRYSGNCRWGLLIAFQQDAKWVTQFVPVDSMRFTRLHPGDSVPVRYDPQSPHRIEVIGDTPDEIDHYLFIGAIIASLATLYLGFGVWVNRRRNQRGWNGPNYG